MDISKHSVIQKAKKKTKKKDQALTLKCKDVSTMYYKRTLPESASLVSFDMPHMESSSPKTMVILLRKDAAGRIY